MNLFDLIALHDSTPLDDKGCKIWKRRIDRDGYPEIKMDGRYFRVTRLILANKLRRPIEKGMLALHTCDNPSCFSEDHLYEGNAKQNYEDSFERGRNVRGERVVTSVLTENQVLEMRRQKAENPGILQKDLAEAYGITQGMVSSILNRKSWKHI